MISKVNGELWDIDRPLEKDCTLKFLKFDDDEGMCPEYFYNFYILLKFSSVNNYLESYLEF